MKPYPGNNRGFSMLELVIALAIMLVVVAMGSTLFVTSANISRDGEQRIGEADDARVAVNEIVNSLRLAGAGMPNGVYYNNSSVPTRIGAVYGIDGLTGAGGTGPVVGPYSRPGTDDLWLVVPDRNGMREGCVDTGASTILTGAGLDSSNLKVFCNGMFPATGLAVVSNLNKGALITITSKPDANHFAFAESGVSGFSDAPEQQGGGGYQEGDLVTKVQLRHYFVNNDASGVPGLYRAAGALSGSDPGNAYPRQGRPFINTDIGELIARNVEDLQITYGYDLSSDGTGKPPLTWQVGLAPAYVDSPGSPVAGPQTLRAVKVSIVIRSAHRQLSSNGTAIISADTAPIPCDEHVPTPTPDGYMRMYYSRTIELPNLSPGGL